MTATPCAYCGKPLPPDWDKHRHQECWLRYLADRKAAREAEAIARRQAREEREARLASAPPDVQARWAAAEAATLDRPTFIPLDITIAAADRLGVAVYRFDEERGDYVRINHPKEPA